MKKKLSFAKKIQTLTFGMGAPSTKPPHIFECKGCGGVWEGKVIHEEKFPDHIMQVGVMRPQRPPHWKN